MTAATAPPPDVAAYLADVREALSDLPDAERDDLLAEVEDSLLEAAGEGGSLAARLGPPAEFAAELRAAAGLHETAPPPRESQLAQSLRALAARLLEHPSVLALRRLGNELAPVWWVARAYLAVGAIAYMLDTGWSIRHPMVPRFGSGEMGIALIVIATVVSVWIGLWMRRHGPQFPRVAAAVNAALVVAIVPVTLDVSNPAGYHSLVAAAYAPPPAATPQLAYDGVPVDNVYPYSRSGRLLHDVLLYDGTGRPLDIGGLGDPQRRLLETVDGTPIFNAFPIRYFEPGTMRVANPDAGPPVVVPEIATPPLRLR